MTAIVPIKDMNRRAPEAGRIRLGVKAGRAMKSIDTFRFTSPHEQAIRDLAQQYGGEPKPWSDPKANAGQYEVITKAKAIDVIVQPGGLSVNYELWSGGGCQRRCDGVTVQIPSKDPNEMYSDAPCICNAKGVAECRPYTRLNVILPSINFYGVWRLESKGWNVAQEMPGMFETIAEMQQRGQMVRAQLHLEPRQSQGGSKKYVVPTLSIGASPNELMGGGGGATAEISPSRAEPVGELEGAPLQHDAGEARFETPEPEVIEAQVVDPDRELTIEANVRSIADQHNLDPEAVVATIWQMTGGDYDKLERFIDKNSEGKTLAFASSGKLTWRSS